MTYAIFGSIGDQASCLRKDNSVSYQISRKATRGKGSLPSGVQLRKQPPPEPSASSVKIVAAFRLISDALPFGRLWYGEPDAVGNATGYAKFRSRSHDAVIRVYDESGNVIETHEPAGEFKEP